MGYSPYKAKRMQSPMKQAEDRQQTYNDLTAKYQQQNVAAQDSLRSEFDKGDMLKSEAIAKSDSINKVYQDKADFSRDSINNAIAQDNAATVKLDSINKANADARYKSYQSDSTLYSDDKITLNEFKKRQPDAFKK